MGYQAMVMSNNKEPRVKSFAEAVGNIGYVYKAAKPAKRSYLHCMDKMGADISNTLFVGDQLFTDVWGAKRCGIFSILVKPIDPKEEIQIVLKRYLERIVLYFYKKERG
jgi:HAD superfamily phosphatase (TIGR01668 family)